jgi:hypothetical protein
MAALTIGTVKLAILPVTSIVAVYLGPSAYLHCHSTSKLQDFRLDLTLKSSIIQTFDRKQPEERKFLETTLELMKLPAYRSREDPAQSATDGSRSDSLAPRCSWFEQERISDSWELALEGVGKSTVERLISAVSLTYEATTSHRNLCLSRCFCTCIDR